jgi:glycosyltransferase involved in cell wall biosynthesis
VEEETNGLLFPAGNAGALAEKMQRFLTEPALCDTWGRASRDRAQYWTPAAGAAKWVEAFQTVLPS